MPSQSQNPDSQKSRRQFLKTAGVMTTGAYFAGRTTVRAEGAKAALAVNGGPKAVTAPHSDAPRLSSIGVFKHYLVSDLLSDRDEENYFPAFVGYVPEGKVPTENLQDMLDGDKILLKPAVPQNQV